ncbi:unnamed protein product [Tuber aestivum]|uniref:Uncharacterized protein n=1 Tax=Tuber aestivum TaxID=59557 RepID=A0A292PPZ8_9PEZI|nr:unnamed protein product [Tuber aestivum]
MYDRTPEKSLKAFKASASLALENLSPGELPSVPTVIPTQRSSPYKFNLTKTDHKNGTRNVGVIVGGVLGGVVFMVVLAMSFVFLVVRKKRGEEENNGRLSWPGKPSIDITRKQKRGNDKVVDVRDLGSGGAYRLPFGDQSIHIISRILRPWEAGACERDGHFYDEQNTEISIVYGTWKNSPFDTSHSGALSVPSCPIHVTRILILILMTSPIIQYYGSFASLGSPTLLNQHEWVGGKRKKLSLAASRSSDHRQADRAAKYE